jgi:RimJ/RimL family protein N-acetyltransferase
VSHYRVVRQRFDAVDRGRSRIFVAIHSGRIIADGCLQLEGHGWGDNVAEIRFIIAEGWKRKGLGTLMAQELFHRAAEDRVDRIVVRMMRPQKAARAIFRKLGFTDEFIIPKHVRDLSGEWQDMVIMRCNLEDLWNDMEFLAQSMDVPRYR